MSLWKSCCALLAGCLLATTTQAAVPLFAPTDPILAIDLDFASVSDYPDQENPFLVADDDPATKYLNFGLRNTGFIVTPVAGSTVVQSILLTTANDAEARDPATWALYGTNEAILSGDDSDGSAENWTLISSGAVAMPPERQTAGPLLSFANATAYTSYRLIFPTVKNPLGANSMQVSEVSFHPDMGGADPDILSFNDNFLAVMLPSPTSRYPGAESPSDGIDGDVNTKYLNFGEEKSGFIITPAVGSSKVTSFQITTANDFDVRDPTSWQIYGTNDPIASTDNSVGDGEAWTLIDEGTVDLPLTRFTAGPVVTVDNTTAYKSYRMIFPTVRDPNGAGADSMQIAEIQFFGDLAGTLLGDVNFDGTVDIFDVNVVSDNWGTAGPTGDANSDGTVDIFDVNVISDNWGATGGGAAAVPEPASLLLLVAGVAGMASLRLRRKR